MTNGARAVAAGLVALAVGGGVFAEVALKGHHAVKRREKPGKHVQARLRPAHGLMLLPLADPDGSVHDRR